MKVKNLPVWDLSDFYPSFDSDELNNDLKTINTNVVKFSKKYRGKLSSSLKKLDLIISEYEKIEEIIVKIKSYIYLYYCTDQLDQKISTFYQKTQEKINDIESHLLFFPLEINKIDAKYIDGISNLKYGHWVEIQRKFKNSRASALILFINRGGLLTGARG